MNDILRPFLVLTLRRTGGTSLVRLMSALSAFPTVQHEPLNPGRLWGDIATRFAQTGDHIALRRDLSEVLRGWPNIKHCFDIADPAVTEALLDACVARGYRVVLLLREDDASRIRSLFLAMATGAWGSDRAAEVFPKIAAGEIALAPVDLAQVRRRFFVDRAAIAEVEGLLAKRRIPHVRLTHEAVYARDGDMAQRAADLLAWLGVDAAPGHPAIRRFAAGTGQKSASVMDYLPNRTDFDAVLAELRAS
ncbi:MAG: hypothetical protein R3D60_11340 [Paracoccaceae bacterium]